jgi:hypothetical protein
MEESSLVNQRDFIGSTALDEYLSPERQYSQPKTDDQMDDFKPFTRLVGV